MNQITFQQTEPSQAEQVVQQTVQGLHWAEQEYSVDFSKAIETLELMYDTHTKQDWKLNPWDEPLTKAQLRDAIICPRHAVFLVPERYGDVDAELVCPQCERELKEGK